MVIDTHAHIIVPEITAAQRPKDSWAPAVTWEDGSQTVNFGGKKISSPLRDFCDISTILEEQTKAGVNHLVLTVWSSLFGYDLPLPHTMEICRVQNEAMARLGKRYPDKLTCLGTVPLQNVEAAIDELVYCVKTLGLPGIEIGSNVNGRYLGDASLRPFWAKVEELGAVVEIHPVPGVGGKTKGEFYLWNVWANPAETSLTAAHMILSGLLDDHPGLKIVLVHGGGHLPYQIGRLDHAYAVRPESAHLQQKPSDYLRMFYFDTITHSAAALRFLIDTVGAEQVIIGSDYPFDMGYTRPAELVQQLNLRNETQTAILSGTAKKLFNI